MALGGPGSEEFEGCATKPGGVGLEDAEAGIEPLGGTAKSWGYLSSKKIGKCKHMSRYAARLISNQFLYQFVSKNMVVRSWIMFLVIVRESLCHVNESTVTVRVPDGL